MKKTLRGPETSGNLCWMRNESVFCAKEKYIRFEFATSGTEMCLERVACTSAIELHTSHRLIINFNFFFFASGFVTSVGFLFPKNLALSLLNFRQTELLDSFLEEKKIFFILTSHRSIDVTSLWVLRGFTYISKLFLLLVIILIYQTAITELFEHFQNVQKSSVFGLKT